MFSRISTRCRHMPALVHENVPENLHHQLTRTLETLHFEVCKLCLERSFPLFISISFVWSTCTLHCTAQTGPVNSLVSHTSESVNNPLKVPLGVDLALDQFLPPLVSYTSHHLCLTLEHPQLNMSSSFHEYAMQPTSDSFDSLSVVTTRSPQIYCSVGVKRRKHGLRDVKEDFFATMFTPTDPRLTCLLRDSTPW